MEIDFKELVGRTFKLTGVEQNQITVKDYAGHDEPANTLSFALDGAVYVATEDPEDGYRSCMRSLTKIEGVIMDNTFDPVDVLARHRTRDDSENGQHDILEFVDVRSGLVVLEVGTRDTDDYYPCFVANWNPENLFVNAQERLRQEELARQKAARAAVKREQQRIEKSPVVAPTRRMIELPD